MALPDTGVIHESTMVKVVNEGPRNFTRDYGGVSYTLEPGRPRMIPYMAMVLWCGDPRSVNIGQREQDQHRTYYVRWLSGFYGTLNDPWYADEPRRTSGSGELLADGSPVATSVYREISPGLYIHPNIPQIAVFDLDDDERLTTVLDDPEGDRVTPVSTTLTAQRDIEDQIRHQDDVLNQLIDILREIAPDKAAQIAAQVGKPATPSVVMPDDDAAVVFDTVPDMDDTATLEDPTPVEAPAVEDTPPSRAPRSKAGAK